jgi:hypothetical protein
MSVKVDQFLIAEILESDTSEAHDPRMQSHGGEIHMVVEEEEF